MRFEITYLFLKFTFEFNFRGVVVRSDMYVGTSDDLLKEKECEIRKMLLDYLL